MPNRKQQNPRVEPASSMLARGPQVERQCLFPGCDRPAGRRGNCGRHYLQHQRAVAKGETAWAELEQLQMVLPARPGQRTDYEAVLSRARAQATPPANTAAARPSARTTHTTAG